MKVLVFGKSGQVARELSRTCPDTVEATFLGRDQADLMDPAACATLIQNADVDGVINAAAWTAVDDAETHEGDARVVNGDAPGAMARACAGKDIPLLHISTDYVFDGAGDQPFTPDHPPAPLGAYGRTKLAGETAVAAAGARHLILRTSWVISAHGSNFVKTMYRLGADRDALNVVEDQIGGPTPARDIALALWTALPQMVAGHGGGIYHFSGAPDASWADLARAVMESAGLACQVNDIPSSDYPTPAVRPLNSRLSCTSFEADFGVARPDWRQGVKQIITDMEAAT